MMERSDEIRDLLFGLMEAMTSGDMDALSGMSASDDLLQIGTDPAEWWEGDRARSAWRGQLEVFEPGMLKFVPRGHAQGFVEGSVGWAAEEFEMTSPVGEGIGVRVTGVWHREDDTWKLIQAHGSIGVPNEESFGENLSV